MKAWLNFLTPLQHLGVTPNLSTHMRRNVILTNNFGLAGVLLTGLFSLMVYFLGITELAVLGTTLTVMDAIILTLNHYRKYTLSRLFLLISANAGVFVAALLSGVEIGAHATYVLTAGLVIAVFETHEIKPIVLCFLMALSLAIVYPFVAADYTQLVVVPPPFRPFVATYIIANVIIFNTFMFYRFRTLNLKAEQELEKKIVELDQTRERLAFASKMAALGEMSAGISHEMNTPLGTIILRADQIRRCYEDPTRSDKIPDLAAEINRTGQRIVQIIEGLKTFSRRESGEEKFSAVDVKTILAEIEAVGRERFERHQIDFTLQVPEETIRILCNAVQISQVLLNLVVNAIHAVEDGTAKKEISIAVEVVHDNVRINVSDSGPGVSPELQQKIFDPFFTTKEVGKGTGLGLSLSKGIIESHNGRLFYDDKKDNKTTFVVELPIHSSNIRVA